MPEPAVPAGLTIDEWLRASRESAIGRGLPDLVPLLEALAVALGRVRDADWNDHAPTPPDHR
jgi:hypothetical protein